MNVEAKDVILGAGAVFAILLIGAAKPSEKEVAGKNEKSEDRLWIEPENLIVSPAWPDAWQKAWTHAGGQVMQYN